MTRPTRQLAPRDYLDYVRGRYAVDVQIGQRVRVDGRLGTVVERPGFPNHYVHVKLDDGITVPCHPTWRMEYLKKEKKID